MGWTYSQIIIIIMKKFLALISIAILLSSCGDSDSYIPMSYSVTSNDSIGTTIIKYSQSVKYKVVNIKPYEELTPISKYNQSPYYTSSQSTNFCVYELKKKYDIAEHNSFGDYITIVDHIGRFNIGDVIIFGATLVK